MQMIRVFLLALLFATAGNPAIAQMGSAKGRATITYAETATPEVKSRAMQAAQVKAVEVYYAEAGEAESQTFDTIRDAVLANLDRYLLDTVVLAEEDRADLKQYSVTLRVQLNVAQLRNLAKNTSPVGRTAHAEKSQLMLLFVSRTVDAVKTYEARVYKRVDATAKADGAVKTSEGGIEGESVSRSKISTNGSRATSTSTSGSSSATVESGGSSVQKADETSWRLLPSADLDTVVTGIFSKANYKVVGAALVEPYSGGKLQLRAIEDDYKSGMDLKPKTRQDIFAGLKVAQVPYLAVATLDAMVPGKDPATGLYRVAVRVNATLFDTTPMIPETLASVGPKLYAGLGPTEDEARTSALKLAAESAARELLAHANNVAVR